jgi:NADPH2:quinone reductase
LPATKPPAVLTVGPGVTNFHPGDRVAYYYTLGGYATERVIPADKLVKLPDHITYEQGAVLMLKGLTVWYLLHKTFKVEPHHRVLIHAAAGGIGLLACQWARRWAPTSSAQSARGEGRPRARQWLRSRHPL